LELGRKTLEFNLGDFVDLSMFHNDTLEWHDVTRQILNGPRSPKFNLDFVKNHLSDAANLDIHNHETEILQALIDLGTQWRDIA
jgi:hypothetical protein